MASPSPKALATGAAAVVAAAAVAMPFIADFEGYRPVGYRDPAPGGYQTVCWGHMQPGVLGKHYTESQCVELLAQDAVRHGLDIDRCIKVAIPTESRAAFTSFAFNAGAAQFCGSTMARKLNAGDLAGACAELSRWTYAGGKQLPGLVKRRTAERKLCEEGL
jgi:lysozyme